MKNDDLLLLNHSTLRMPRTFLQRWYFILQRELTGELPKKRVQDLHGSLTVVFLDTAAAKKINQQFRQRSYATDVLSFAPADPADLGELIICPQVVLRQSKEHGLTYRAELAYMVLHGLLHLLGYDHETSDADAKKMFTLQDRVFARAAKKMRLDW